MIYLGLWLGRFPTTPTTGDGVGAWLGRFPCVMIRNDPLPAAGWRLSDWGTACGWFVTIAWAGAWPRSRVAGPWSCSASGADQRSCPSARAPAEGSFSCDRVARPRFGRCGGIRPKPPAGVGLRSWWLEQIIAYTPLDAWHRVGVKCEHVAALKSSDEHALAVGSGFARAAQLQQDPTWATQLLPFEPRLARFADRALVEQAAIDQLRDGDTEMAKQLDIPWSPAMSQRALTIMVDQLVPHAKWEPARVIVERADPSAASDTHEQIERLALTGAAATQAERLLETLTFRQAMYQELQESSESPNR
jgi:hypothetical protein